MTAESGYKVMTLYRSDLANYSGTHLPFYRTCDSGSGNILFSFEIFHSVNQSNTAMPAAKYPPVNA